MTSDRVDQEPTQEQVATVDAATAILTDEIFHPDHPVITKTDILTAFESTATHFMVEVAFWHPETFLTVVRELKKCAGKGAPTRVAALQKFLAAGWVLPVVVPIDMKDEKAVKSLCEKHEESVKESFKILKTFNSGVLWYFMVTYNYTVEGEPDNWISRNFVIGNKTTSLTVDQAAPRIRASIVQDPESKDQQALADALLLLIKTGSAENPAELSRQCLIQAHSFCRACKKVSSSVKQCAKCKYACYCDATCLKLDWKNHKGFCESEAAIAAKLTLTALFKSK